MNGLEALKIAKETGRRFKYPEGKNFYSTKELNIEFHRGIEFKTLFAEGWEVEPALIDHISVRVKVYDMGEIVEDATTTPEDAIARIQRYAHKVEPEKPKLKEIWVGNIHYREVDPETTAVGDREGWLR